MDIKNTFGKYQLTIDKNINIDLIKKSIDLLINSNIDYEFRTTVVKEYHEPSDFIKIGEMINGAKKYFIQCYQYQDSVRVKGLNPLTKEELMLCLENIGDNVLYKALREID
jgi:pyruvate formate lyase activating enzyme